MVAKPPKGFSSKKNKNKSSYSTTVTRGGAGKQKVTETVNHTTGVKTVTTNGVRKQSKIGGHGGSPKPKHTKQYLKKHGRAKSSKDAVDAAIDKAFSKKRKSKTSAGGTFGALVVIGLVAWIGSFLPPPILDIGLNIFGVVIAIGIVIALFQVALAMLPILLIILAIWVYYFGFESIKELFF